MDIEIPDLEGLDALAARDLIGRSQQLYQKLKQFELLALDHLQEKCPHPEPLVIRAPTPSGEHMLGCQGCGRLEIVGGPNEQELPWVSRQWTEEEIQRAMSELRELEPHERELMAPARPEPLFDDPVHHSLGYN
ncbi:MAG TPA: hypothetical protein VLF21_01755 [Candidatus Saccharimonadales bacterium]|nr:hypothetical protein [Candidatus Saccharimonadales bacterium]